MVMGGGFSALSTCGIFTSFFVLYSLSVWIISFVMFFGKYIFIEPTRIPLSSFALFSVVLSLPCSQLALPNLSWKHAKKAGAGDTNSSILNNGLYQWRSECIYREIHDVIQKWLQRQAMRRWEAAVSSQLQLVSKEGRSDGHVSAGLNHPQVEA